MFPLQLHPLSLKIACQLSYAAASHSQICGTIFSAMGWYMFLAPEKVSSANFFPPSALLWITTGTTASRISCALGIAACPRRFERTGIGGNLSCSHLQRISLFLDSLSLYSSSRDLTTLTERACEPATQSARRKWSTCIDEKSLMSSADAPRAWSLPAHAEHIAEVPLTREPAEASETRRRSTAQCPRGACQVW